MKLFYRVFVALGGLVLYACGTGSENKEKMSIAGNWLVLYPDHSLNSNAKMRIYSKHQDSIVKLYGLKLLKFDSSGSFMEMDSTQTTGKWSLDSDSTVEVRSGGKGFTGFFTKWIDYKKDTLQLLEYVPLENKQVELVWHLKRIGDADDKSKLFETVNQEWRMRPGQPETEKQIRERLSKMLGYYASYFYLVGRESTYFIPARVALPFKYYQHAIYMKPEMSDQFISFFYDEAQAEKAWEFLDHSVRIARDEFPRKKDFVVEYAAFMEILSRHILLENK